MTPIFSRFLVVTAAILLSLFAMRSWAQDTRVASNEPTLQQIYQAANGGNLDRADAMVNEVLKTHPNSAKAHYVKAEIAARQGKTELAKQELAKAEQIAPGLPFVRAESAQALRNQLAGATARPSANSTRQMGAAPSERPADRAPAQRSFPWGTLLVVGAIVLVGVAVLRRRQAAMAAGGYGGAYGNTSAAPYGQAGNGPVYPPNAGGAMPPGYGPGYPQQQPGMGSTLGRGLATGAAIGAGMMAADAIGRNVFGHGAGANNAHAAGADPNIVPPTLDQIDDGMRRNLNTDMGGDNFGINDGGWDAGGGGDLGGDGGGGGDW